MMLNLLSKWLSLNMQTNFFPPTHRVYIRIILPFASPFGLLYWFVIGVSNRRVMNLLWKCCGNDQRVICEVIAFDRAYMFMIRILMLVYVSFILPLHIAVVVDVGYSIHQSTPQKFVSCQFSIHRIWQGYVAYVAFYPPFHYPPKEIVVVDVGYSIHQSTPPHLQFLQFSIPILSYNYYTLFILVEVGGRVDKYIVIDSNNRYRIRL